jgi:hypothetical protein
MHINPIVAKQSTISRGLFKPVKTPVLRKNLRSERHRFFTGKIGPWGDEDYFLRRGKLRGFLKYKKILEYFKELPYRGKCQGC